MKSRKAQSVLYLFEKLQREGFIRKEEVLSELEITELCFWRYIQEIEAFIYNFHLPYELSYDRKKMIYVMREIRAIK